MITRVVKLSILPEKQGAFLALFAKNNESIKAMPGCTSVRGFQSDGTDYFFTISNWKSEDDLNNYRQSELFGAIWPTVKTWMNDKPEAWTLKEI